MAFKIELSTIVDIDRERLHHRIFPSSHKLEERNSILFINVISSVVRTVERLQQPRLNVFKKKRASKVYQLVYIINPRN